MENFKMMGKFYYNYRFRKYFPIQKFAFMDRTEFRIIYRFLNKTTGMPDE
jgi:hypothetical protein